MAINHFSLWFEQPIVTIDVETTGFDAAGGDRVLEVAAVRVEGLRIVDRWQKVVNPRRPIPADASRVHGFYDEDVELACDFYEIAPELLTICRGAVPCAYSQGFDRRFLTMEFSLARLSGLQDPVIAWDNWLDPLDWVRSIDRFVTDGSKKVSNDLASACRRRGVVLSGAHGALADAAATAELLIALHSEMPRCTISELIRRQLILSDASERRWQAAKAAGRTP